jgi:hypothetical protein
MKFLSKTILTEKITLISAVKAISVTRLGGL